MQISISNFTYIEGGYLRIVLNNFAQPECPIHQESVYIVRTAVETRLALEASSFYWR
jgi:hypothetical protein